MQSRDRRKDQYHITNANSSQKKKKYIYIYINAKKNHLELKRELGENLFFFFENTELGENLILLTLMNLFKGH